ARQDHVAGIDATQRRTLESGPRRRRRIPGPSPGIVPELSETACPFAGQPPPARAARPVRPGPGNVPARPPGVRGLPGWQRAGAGRLAPADPDPQPGQSDQAASEAGTRPPSRGVAGGAARPLRPVLATGPGLLGIVPQRPGIASGAGRAAG